MKMKNVWIYPLLLLGVLLNSCMTPDDPGIADIEKAKQLDMNIIKGNAASRKGDSPIDADGNTYSIVQIGTQLWMAENLRTTRYNDGTDIPLKTEVWDITSVPAFTWPNNDKETYGEYGALYNWYAVNTGKLCPKGWHIPSQSEWTSLVNYLGGSSVAGNKMKEAGTIHWPDPNDGTNESGFTALPAGHQWLFTTEFGTYAGWWSATGTNDPNYAGHIYISEPYQYQAVLSGSFKSEGQSCRCLKDNETTSHSATGSGNVTINNIHRVFTHAGNINANGMVTGYFDLNRTGGIHVGGSVIALSVVGNIAYFAGVIETTNSDVLDWSAGHYVLWSTIDNGEGINSVPDKISYLYGFAAWTEEYVKSWVQNPEEVAYFDIEQGNVQVH